MRYNKKRFIYLISPPKINKSFLNDLNEVLKQNKVSFFQLRLKKECFKEKLKIGKKINADGCHLGQNDMNIIDARKIIGNKIIGVTCHNSIKLAKIAIKNKADYIALGAFNSSKTKKVKYKASLYLLKKARKIINAKIVAIGGINSMNYKKLLLNNVNFLAISSFIWNNKKYKPSEALKKLK